MLLRVERLPIGATARAPCEADMIATTRPWCLTGREPPRPGEVLSALIAEVGRALGCAEPGASNG